MHHTHPHIQCYKDTSHLLCGTCRTRRLRHTKLHCTNMYVCTMKAAKWSGASPRDPTQFTEEGQCASNVFTIFSPVPCRRQSKHAEGDTMCVDPQDSVANTHKYIRLPLSVAVQKIHNYICVPLPW